MAVGSSRFPHHLLGHGLGGLGELEANGRALGLADLGYYDSQTLLMVAAKSFQELSKVKQKKHGKSS